MLFCVHSSVFEGSCQVSWVWWVAFSCNIWFFGKICHSVCSSQQVLWFMSGIVVHDRGLGYPSIETFTHGCMRSCLFLGSCMQPQTISVNVQIFLMFSMFGQTWSWDSTYPRHREYLVKFSKYIVIIIWKIWFLTEVHEYWPRNKQVV